MEIRKHSDFFIRTVLSSFVALHEIILKANIISRCAVVIPESQETSNRLKVSLVTSSFVRTFRCCCRLYILFHEIRNCDPVVPMILTDVAGCRCAFSK